MGINYYLHERDMALHIGKSSFGWCFGLHVIPALGLNSLDDWVQRLGQGGIIRDEDYAPVSLEEMLETIKHRSGRMCWNSPETRQFLGRNSASPGPNGLLRHKIDGRNCVGHGNGTWDLIAGEFS